VKNQRKKKRMIFVVSALAISLAALAFVIINFRDNIVFFYSPSELENPQILKKIHNRQIRIGGLVKENSVKKINSLTTEFIVTDLKKELRVEYVGILPDLFRERQGVVAKGQFDEQKNQFYSRELLIKHDEKYMPPEVKKALK
jgi:cytochrome c-type biogenesis protein CcmE